jgi:hypothetical protein
VIDDQEALGEFTRNVNLGFSRGVVHLKEGAAGYGCAS